MADFDSRVYPGQTEGKQLNAPILDFRNRIGDLARPNLFQVEIGFPGIVDSGTPNSGATPGSQEQRTQESAGASQAGSGSSSLSLSSFLVKAANIPASTVGVIEVPYRGRTLKIAGDRTFEPWTVTVLNDKGFALRSKFEEWSTKIQALQQNLQQPRTIAEYQSNAVVRQYDRQGGIVRTYQFVGIWPSNISAIDLAWDSNDTAEEYTVEFQVQYWTYANDANAGNAV
jgi:hypothetical protein